MIVNVYMADGRTTFQFASRKDLYRLLERAVDGDDRWVKGWVSWRGDDRGWRAVRMTSIRKNSISYTLAAEDIATSDEDLPAKATAQKRQADWEARRPQDDTEREA